MRSRAGRLLTPPQWHRGIDITCNHLELTAKNLELNRAEGMLTEGDLTAVADVPGVRLSIRSVR
jgi:hypothetical protein